MSASRYLNQHQMKLFMTASELQQIPAGDRHGYESPAGMWAEKKEEADFEGLTADIRRNGVEDPVDILHGHAGPELWDGHHRVAASAALDAEDGKQRYIPVVHHLPGR